MKTLEEIKKWYDDEVEARVAKEGIEFGHSRWDIKDEILSDMVEQFFDNKLPEDKEIRKWFEKECNEIDCYLNTECF